VPPPVHPANLPEAALFESEPVVLEAYESGVEAEAAPATMRNVPTPPFELSKERRREAAAPLPLDSFPPSADFVPEVKPVEQAGSVWEPVLPLEVKAAPADSLPSAPPLPETRAVEMQETPQEAIARKAKENVQEQMRFEPVNRGRFEKTDPTIVDGEDLDVPTFMRQRVPLEP
jgi:cell division protein FtsZ